MKLAGPTEQPGELRSWGMSIVLTRLWRVDDPSGGSKNADVYDMGRIFIVFFVSFLKESLYPCFTLFSTFSFAQGFVPFLVSATAGTTVYGAFDPLLAVADICKKYKIWMHVDVSIP